MRLQELSFQEWIEHAFSHEVRFRKPEWFFDDDADWWDPEPAKAAAYVTRLSENPEEPLRWFTDEQIAQGLTYLVSTSASGDDGWLYSMDVAIAERICCVGLVASLFAKLFVPRCTAHLSHLSEPGAGALNVMCYMWWDEFPCIALPGDPELYTMHKHALQTMERILALDSAACQESAFHELGHCQHQYPEQVEKIIDRFLEKFPEVDARLLTYAKSARCGCVL